MVHSALETLIAERHAQDLRDTWQGRTLKLATGKTGAVLLSVLAHSYDEHMPILLRVIFPGFKSITAPFLTSCGRVMKNGAVVADVFRALGKQGMVEKKTVLYRNEIALRDDFRKLADRAQLSDEERVELFGAVKRWLVSDYRIDPLMDPQDPDAKRLH